MHSRNFIANEEAKCITENQNKLATSCKDSG